MSSKILQSIHTILLLTECIIMAMAVTVTKDNVTRTPSREETFSVRFIGRSLAQCFGSVEKFKCLEMQLADVLENALSDNSTWHCSDFLTVEKLHASKSEIFNLLTADNAHKQRSLGDNIAEKLFHLVQTRSLRLQLPRSGISDALDSLSSNIAALTPPLAAGPTILVDAFGADEGRKKKDKDKNMAMMGGMAMMAMFAQMFLGKVLLLAGAAFIMAKIALLISILGSLKHKGSSGSSGNTEHVIVTSGGGGGGHGGGHDSHDSSGWHRSMPYEYPKLEVVEHEQPPHHTSGMEEHGAPSGPPPSTGGGHFKPSHYNYEETETEPDDVDEFKRRRQTIGVFL